MRAALEASLSAIAGAGARLIETPVPGDDSLALWDAIALPDGYASEGAVVEAHRALVGDDAAGITLGGEGISTAAYLDAMNARADYARRWTSVFDEVGVLLMPTMPTTAFPVGQFGPDSVAGEPVPPGYDRWCALMMPAKPRRPPCRVLPIGTGRDGLPVAAQVMGARWTDATVLRAAALLDAAVTR